MRKVLFAVLPLVLAACGSTQVTLPYAPTSAAPVAPAGRPLVSLDRVDNQRSTGREDPTWVGTIRGGYGNPIKALNTTEPLDRVIGQAFRDGLAQRGLAAGAGQGRYALAVVIHQFDANQYVRREATADFSVVVTERTTGREVYRDRERAYNVDGSVLALDTGVFASTDNLQRVAVQTMNQAIDRLLDKPGFRSAIRT
jgi:uncharacterized lipoprotein YajG